jgi:hypothetical protein
MAKQFPGATRNKDQNAYLLSQERKLDNDSKHRLRYGRSMQGLAAQLLGFCLPTSQTENSTRDFGGNERSMEGYRTTEKS